MADHSDPAADALTVPGTRRRGPSTAPPVRTGPGPIDEDGDTFPVDVGPDDDTVDPSTAFEAAGGFPDRYKRGELIGAGGMGEVRAFTDRLTGRTVAMKTLRGDREPGTAGRRFAREARVQAQLEHPSVVPVYDVGTDAAGGLYFTMKRVRGAALSGILARLREGHPDAVRRFTRRKLLTLLSTVAMTLEYAHRRGVVHRDLKPANVMIGAFDEVYVLDWGLADLRARAASQHSSGAVPIAALAARIGAVRFAAAAEAPLVDSSLPPATVTGQVVGTPGYVAPECLAEPERAAEPAADLYALGVMLYEILTLRRLHGGDTVDEVFSSALQLDGARPREAAPDRDVPPELDALCHAATRRDPVDRPTSAAAFARAIEAYLDGDRDVERRRELSSQAATVAAAALGRSRAAGADELAARAIALREVVSALGLDPENAQARGTLVRLLTEPGPAAARAAERAHRAEAVKSFQLAARSHIVGILSYALYLPLLFVMGVRSWPAFAVMAASILATGALSVSYMLRPPADLRMPLVHLLLSTIATGSGVVLFGPLVLVPAIATAVGVGYLATFGDRAGWVAAAVVGVVIGPALLGALGVVPKSYELTGDAIVILPGMLDFPPGPTLAFLLMTHAVVIGGCLWFVWRLRVNYLEAERRLRVQAWTLAQLVPEDSRDMITAPSTAPSSPRTSR